ncbi:response regulator [Paenibacillus sp. MBLB4367]|uniref:response regulator n=1 Tax=Paenibacillus sp. MBLB4367 TaxID=3384767 RepID=UPI0039080B9D
MKVMIVDDHPLVRKGLSSVLSLEPNVSLCGESETISEALEMVRSTEPDLALIDLRLGRENGLDLVEQIRSRYSCKCVILTSSTNEHDFRRAQEIGADGYVLKEALPEELLYAVRLIARGRKYYDPGLMELMMRTDIPEDDGLITLTPKEREVLSALGEGLSNKDIARKLVITEFTVKKHVSQILSKLELTDRTQAALFSLAKGLSKNQWESKVPVSF